MYAVSLMQFTLTNDLPKCRLIDLPIHRSTIGFDGHGLNVMLYG